VVHLGRGSAVLLGAFVFLSTATESQALIGTADIAASAVTTPKIKNLAVTGAKIGNLAITAPKIATGAVTPRKISSNRNVVVVAPAGGDFTSPVDALASIADASADNPYLVKVMPGRYNVGAASVIMKEFVDLEGSGEGVTVIEGTVSTPFNDADPNDTRPLYGVVTMADDSEVRFLSVINSGAAAGTKCVTAILSRDTYGILSHVTGGANGTNCNVGIIVNVTEAGSQDVVLLRDVRAVAEGGVTAIGMAVRGAVAEMTAALLNTIVQAQGGSTNNFGLNVNSASPIVTGGLLMAEGGAVTLALRGTYGLPTLQGVLARGAVSFYGNAGVAVVNQSTTGAVFVKNAVVDIFSSSIGGPVTVSDDGAAGSTPPVARCAGVVRTDTLATLGADCSTP
jgi:hypothetical protein